MQINMGQKSMNTTQERGGVVRKPSVVIGTLKKESEMLDSDGNVIDPRTKQIIRPFQI